MARAGYWNHNVHYQPVYLAHPIADASFDFACANTSLHHMDFAAALTAMARALRPGGRLAVIGLAANQSVGDYLADAPGIAVGLAYRAVYGKANPGAPIKDPEMTWAEVRAAACRLLPGVRYRRHLLFRYSLLWSKPAWLTRCPGRDPLPDHAPESGVRREAAGGDDGACTWATPAQLRP
jgi:SAM-dependent methyltransferase